MPTRLTAFLSGGVLLFASLMWTTPQAQPPEYPLALSTYSSLAGSNYAELEIAYQENYISERVTHLVRCGNERSGYFATGETADKVCEWLTRHASVFSHRAAQPVAAECMQIGGDERQVFITAKFAKSRPTEQYLSRLSSCEVIAWDKYAGLLELTLEESYAESSLLAND